MRPHDLVLTKRGVRFQNTYFPCSIGKTGTTSDKIEGDGATPVGIHNLVGVYYRPDRISSPVPWATPIGPTDLWSDDVNDRAYNQHVQTPHSFSHECLRRADPLYDLILVTDWNWRTPVRGNGSAIFIHQWRRPGFPTEGCVAFSRAHLRFIAANITRRSRLIIR